MALAETRDRSPHNFGESVPRLFGVLPRLLPNPGEFVPKGGLTGFSGFAENRKKPQKSRLRNDRRRRMSGVPALGLFLFIRPLLQEGVNVVAFEADLGEGNAKC